MSTHYHYAISFHIQHYNMYTVFRKMTKHSWQNTGPDDVHTVLWQPTTMMTMMAPSTTLHSTQETGLGQWTPHFNWRFGQAGKQWLCLFSTCGTIHRVALFNEHCNLQSISLRHSPIWFYLYEQWTVNGKFQSGLQVSKVIPCNPQWYMIYNYIFLMKSFLYSCI